MNIRISTVVIDNFRGIPGKLTIDFESGSKNQPKSLILFGDNGTGKSSVVDAIQFAIQGEIGKERKLTSLISLSSKYLPLVQITLSDGRIICRILVSSVDEKIRISNSNRDKDFYVAPFVLRRSDILNFLNTPDEKRQIVFFDYRFTKDNIQDEIQKNSGTFGAENRELQEQSIAKKNKRRKLVEKLAKKIGLIVEDIPLEQKDFSDFVRDKIHDGLTAKERTNLKKGDIGYADPIVHNLVKEIREVTLQIKNIQQEKKNFQKYEAKLARDSIVKEVISKAESRITESFQAISRCDFLDQIELLCGDISATSLSINVHLKNGRCCSPHHIFSEANLDLLVLLVFLSLAKEAAEKTQAKFLILDDVLQSIDSTIRVSIVDYLLKEFSDWQLIFTVHDRLWRSQLCDLFRRNGHEFIESEIVRWNFDNGPTVFNTSKDIDYFLLEAIEAGQVVNICSQAGLLLEEVCDKLSWILPTSIIRKKGDKYTLGDLWPGIYKTLKKTNMKVVVDEVDKWLHLRNLVGAHYNEWARSLSLQEAQLFAEAVLHIFWEVRCNKCFRWIEPLGSQGKHWACRCKKLNVLKE
jgi:energy-coupling factor transporter ATP-binding protein EcfA2